MEHHLNKINLHHLIIHLLLKGPNQYGNDVFEIQVHANKIKASDSLEHTGGLDNAIVTDHLEKGEIYDTNADY